MILNQNNEYAAVLDACVLLPMPLCDTLLRLAEDPAFYRPLWSQEILREVGDAMETRLKLTKDQRDYRLSQMQKAFPEAMVRIPKKLLETFDCPDKDDRHVLACAVKGQANAIVTKNTKHFPPECLEEYGILCQPPDEFLVHQFYLGPQEVVEKLDRQAAAIRKQRDYTLSLLVKDAPVFCSLIHQHFPI